jgi:hypothetical protein
MAVALTRSSLAQHGRSGLARQWLPIAVVLGALGVLAAAVVGDWSTLAAQPDAEHVFAEVQRLGATGAAAIVLWPFRALVRLPFSMSAAEFWPALPAALGIAALNYVWVLRADAAFEEAAADHAEKQSRDRVAVRPVARGTAPTPFTLAADGRPETAILWKNLILVGRYVSLRTLVRIAPIIIAFGVVAETSGAKGVTEFLAIMCLPLGIMAVLLGPQMMRNDLRQDLGQLALLKTWPVGGPEIVRGEVLAPAVVVTAVAWLFILLATLLAGNLPVAGRTGVELMLNRLSYAAAAALLAPALVFSQTVVQNGIAVIFPAWVAIGTTRARGIDAMGQRVLMLAGNLLALALSLVPGLVIGGVVAIAVYALTGVILIVLPALLISVTVLVECWVATELLGRVLDRTDVSAVDAAEQ